MRMSLIAPMTALGIVLGVVAGLSGAAHAQQEQIYGGQMMTERERNELRAQMQAATSNEERERIRWEHHQKMQARAKERGTTLPDAPPMWGMHQGQGPGRGGQGRLRVPQGGGGRRGG